MSDFNKKYIKETIFFVLIVFLAVFLSFRLFDLVLSNEDLQKAFFLPLIYRIIKYPFARRKEA